MKKIFCFAAFFISLSVFAQSKISIIPLPKILVEQKGSFELSNKVILHYRDASLKPLVELAITGIADASGFSLQTKSGASQQKNAKIIYLQINESAITNDEGYTLDVTANSIIIKAKKENGLFYGIQTLLQLIPLQGSKAIPAVHIEDEPRFQWRGMMMDVCRHIWSVDFIKKFIDQLAYHKLNKFHWHLT